MAYRIFCYKLNFQYVKGIKCTADCLFRLLDVNLIDPDLEPIGLMF